MNKDKRYEFFARLRAANPAPRTELVYASEFQLLVAVILAANAALMHLLVTVAGLPILAGKVLTEAALFTLSYKAQRRFVFAGRRTAGEISASIATENADAGRREDCERAAAAV